MRDGFTYRANRRNAWHEARQTMLPKTKTPWASINRLSDGRWFGEPDVKRAFPVFARSKYMPHESVKRGGTGPRLAA